MKNKNFSKIHRKSNTMFMSCSEYTCQEASRLESCTRSSEVSSRWLFGRWSFSSCFLLLLRNLRFNVSYWNISVTSLLSPLPKCPLLHVSPEHPVLSNSALNTLNCDCLFISLCPTKVYGAPWMLGFLSRSLAQCLLMATQTQREEIIISWQLRKWNK